MMIVDNQKDIFEYLAPIVNSCSGFIKTEGYVLAKYNDIIFMSSDGCVLSFTETNTVVSPTVFAKSRTFLGCNKEPENFINNTYTIGNNLIMNNMDDLYRKYRDFIMNNNPIYSYNDIISNNIFSQAIGKKASDGISWFSIPVSDTGYQIKIPVSKILTPLNKSDKCNLHIYIDGQFYIPRYEIYKKKFNLTFNVIFRGII